MNEYSVLTLNSCQVRAKIANEFHGILTKHGGMPPMILGAVTQANWTAWVRFPAARVKDAHVYSGPGAHHRISLTPSPLLRRGEREIFPAHLWWQNQEAPE